VTVLTSGSFVGQAPRRPRVLHPAVCGVEIESPSAHRRAVGAAACRWSADSGGWCACRNQRFRSTCRTNHAPLNSRPAIGLATHGGKRLVMLRVVRRSPKRATIFCLYAARRSRGYLPSASRMVCAANRADSIASRIPSPLLEWHGKPQCQLIIR